MSKTKKSPAAPPARGPAAKPATPPVQVAKDGTRELVESLVIAFILAFLFRTFEAEAFQIPTGSMGPTLMGRHKDVVCPRCGYEYQTASSMELDDDTGRYIPENEVVSTTCPVCRFTADVGPADPSGRSPSYKGDRIWVSKAPYETGEPQRWDVAVFKFPRRAEINYIKRLVGLPNESIEIALGEILAGDGGQGQIAAKPPEKILAMMQPVDDSDHVVDKLGQLGWPQRWQPDSSGDDQWSSDDRGRSFGVDGSRASTATGAGAAGTDQANASPAEAPGAWLRYHHYVPSYEDWQRFDQGIRVAQPPRPQLISDFCSFNTATVIGYAGQRRRDPSPPGGALGLHWVGDLILEAELDVDSDEGQIVFELVEGGERFQCLWDIASGQARLTHVGEPAWQVEVATGIQGRGRHVWRFANVDEQLLLWVDDELLEAASYVSLSLPAPRPTPRDLSPAGIASRGARARARHLRLSRDVYYIAFGGPDANPFAGPVTDLLEFRHDRRLQGEVLRTEVAELLANPDRWSVYEAENRDRLWFELEADQFLALGDNSPNSSDSRFWGREFWVDRELLIGKALFVYWPHAWETWPHLAVPGTDVRVPFYPNFSRMRRIR